MMVSTSTARRGLRLAGRVALTVVLAVTFIMVRGILLAFIASLVVVLAILAIIDDHLYSDQTKR
jgi:hypothetical protein